MISNLYLHYISVLNSISILHVSSSRWSIMVDIMVHQLWLVQKRSTYALYQTWLLIYVNIVIISVDHDSFALKSNHKISQIYIYVLQIPDVFQIYANISWYWSLSIYIYIRIYIYMYIYVCVCVCIKSLMFVIASNTPGPCLSELPQLAVVLAAQCPRRGSPWPQIRWLGWNDPEI